MPFFAMLASFSLALVAALALSPLAACQNSSREVIQLDLASLAALPLPFDSRNFTSPYYVSTDGKRAVAKTAADVDRFAFQVSNRKLAAPLLGDSPSISVLIDEPGYAWAHEAPVYFPDTDDVYLCSNAGAPLGRSNATTNNKVFRFNLGFVLAKHDKGEEVTLDADVQEVAIDSDNVQMTNGGTNYGDKLLLANSGRTAQYAGNIALVDRKKPKEFKVLVNNAAGRQFNAPNDVVVHPKSGAIFFTDAWYGRTQDFRPDVDLPEVVWRFNPYTGELTALTDPTTVYVPNGLAFSPDGSKLYIVDSSPIITGTLPPKPKRPASIYEFDVVSEGGIERLANRRLFAWPWTGIADGIKVDTKGNVYAGTSDGVQVWNKHGRDIFRAFLGTGVANLVLAKNGRIIVAGEERLYLIQLDKNVKGPPLWNYPTAGDAQ
ncbi:hypothetical protein ACQY0O_006387 [Thecaphora frezii]